MLIYNIRIVLKTRQYASFKCYRREEWGKTPPPSGLLQDCRRCYYQTPAVGCFLLSPAKKSLCYLGENELPNISRLNRLIPKWAPEGVGTIICSLAASVMPPPPSNISCYFTSTCLPSSCTWNLRRSGIVILQKRLFRRASSTSSLCFDVQSSVLNKRLQRNINIYSKTKKREQIWNKRLQRMRILLQRGRLCEEPCRDFHHRSASAAPHQVGDTHPLFIRAEIWWDWNTR